MADAIRGVGRSTRGLIAGLTNQPTAFLIAIETSGAGTHAALAKSYIEFDDIDTRDHEFDRIVKEWKAWHER
jgi:hypothetical protein